MEKHRLVSMLSAKVQRRVQPLEVVRQVVGVKWPEVLLVCEQVHDFGSIGIAGERLQNRRHLFQRYVVACDIDLGEDEPTRKILQGLMVAEGL